MGTSAGRVGVAVSMLAGAGLALAAIPTAALSQAVPVYAETPADALARNVKILADSPKDFDALIAAGKAALELGETAAAAGFFGRAEEVNPKSPQPKTGMGAALVATDDPNGALTYFASAQALGARVANLGCDRGLAYDLLGKQVAAQTDYRAALRGPDRDEARRRLALSLAISGKKTLALSALAPLLVRHDQGAQRVRALVLALDGDLVGAKSALDYTMPGASARMDPFFRRLPTLTSSQKAAAVHLGIFPENAVRTASGGVGGDRLESIENLLRRSPSAPVVQLPPAQAYRPLPAPAVASRRAQTVRTASVSTSTIDRSALRHNEVLAMDRVASDPGSSKIWLQLASGRNPEDFSDEFRRIRSREPDLFTGISGFVAASGSRSRLLIGPFHSHKDARLFADALQSANIHAFSWVSQPGQAVRKLGR